MQTGKRNRVNIDRFKLQHSGACHGLSLKARQVVFLFLCFFRAQVVNKSTCRVHGNLVTDPTSPLPFILHPLLLPPRLQALIFSESDTAHWSLNLCTIICSGLLH
ncbi:hypothetical protein HHX47_DHR9000575 [Lentinula edodes]|nr:hypothetical protein HHX47_DHR9000575 [Lentinula edodes]